MFNSIKSKKINDLLDAYRYTRIYNFKNIYSVYYNIERNDISREEQYIKMFRRALSNKS